MNTFNAEQTAALQALAARHNESAGTSLTLEQYLDLVCLNLVDDEVKAAFDRSVARLSNAAASLPYEQRLALIDQVESSLP